MSANASQESFWFQLRLQLRVIWALMLRETVTRFGREGLGMLWMIAEPAMFVVGVMIIFSFIETGYPYGISPAEYLAVSYPTLLFWRNGTGRVTGAININRALLHHQPIRPMDIIYSRILLEFSSSMAVFLFLFPIFIVVGICHVPDSILTMALGYLLIIWFSFGFVLIMAGLAELSETIEKTSHIILYLMLPISGVFIPTFLVPEPYRSYLLYFPLIDAVDYFHHGYFGSGVPSYYHISYTLFALTGMTLFGLAISGVAIKRVKVS
ncbi:ABC transporter permease [Acidithiobacillus ferridurans]|jgi:capsular polysaccharide transport system permease protein|uniref:ABC transporter permease n=2 Tax=Acidithiobacillus ferridurans TaxID=1232575 RepID=A0A8X8GBK8_ACIFI|nr:ABC transporter permease [Acidithiobacillus ferridurans]MBU2716514.1 ABC transporter permease [Acidithiobacillus ferridurans]MBU2724230.1 ABC transporter permease [Acidithiobacillus ferridurans]MBU2726108.1 ABC transporter permease [Acidithiobacillus ferridurans]BBF64697.1 Polysialic acid transport protein KpsM [Acidithiobacillus ferridurans]